MIPPILADLDPADFTDDSDLVVPLGGDVKYLIIAVAIIVSAVVIWAIFIRKPRDERARLYRDMASTSDREASPGPAPGSTEQRRRRRRRSRNPTLAETGGLPPRRDTTPEVEPP